MIVILLGATEYRSLVTTALRPEPSDVRTTIEAFRCQLEDLKHERTQRQTFLQKYRKSVGYIYAVYRVGFPNRPPIVKGRVSGTGFLIDQNLLATNRHVAEPWSGDFEASQLIKQGASPALEILVIYFPDLSSSLRLSQVALSSTSDIAILRVSESDKLRGRPALQLAPNSPLPGEPVVVMGYPLGMAGMIAKAPREVNQRLDGKPRDIHAINELAARALVRPSATWGHVGDIIGDLLVYDAATARGGSGGPVFNSNGEVIAINSAYVDGFLGGSIGISVESLRALLRTVS